MTRIRRHRQGGFTLTEVMVTVAIMAIMTGIAIPSLLAWMPDIQLRNAATELKGAFIRARSLAINQGTEYRVLIDPAQGTYQVERGNLMNNANQWTPVSATLPLDGGIIVTSTSPQMEMAGSTPFVRFGVNGSVTTNVDSLMVTLTNSKSHTYQVSIQRRTGHAITVKG